MELRELFTRVISILPLTSFRQKQIKTSALVSLPAHEMRNDSELCPLSSSLLTYTGYAKKPGLAVIGLREILNALAAFNYNMKVM